MLKNIFEFDIPELNKENFHTLLKTDYTEIKVITSNTISDKKEFVSNKDEWVLLLQGCAKLKINDTIYKLKKGDTVFIPAHTKHTLIKTKKVAYWLSVYL